MNDRLLTIHNMLGELLFLCILTLQSCNMCSQHVVSSSRETWSSISDVGYPIIADSIPSIILERYCYSVSYNPNTRQPNWVMWQLTDEHVTKRDDSVWNEYREDQDLPSDIRSTLLDYANSGYDRGHMCPGGDCNWDKNGRDETFLLSNMCPQNPLLNRGDWKEIEIACRKWAKDFGSIFIVTGPIFFKSQNHETIGPNHIPVPEAFFKVIICTDKSHPKGIGFICRNTEGNRKKDFYVNSIRQVERVTGHKFFPLLESSIKSATFDIDDIYVWNSNND